MSLGGRRSDGISFSSESRPLGIGVDAIPEDRDRDNANDDLVGRVLGTEDATPSATGLASLPAATSSSTTSSWLTGRSRGTRRRSWRGS
jgi:hypothetical protein